MYLLGFFFQLIIGNLFLHYIFLIYNLLFILNLYLFLFIFIVLFVIIKYIAVTEVCLVYV